jgi:hypothetical protein
MGLRRQSREAALQILYLADVARSARHTGRRHYLGRGELSPERPVGLRTFWPPGPWPIDRRLISSSPNTPTIGKSPAWPRWIETFFAWPPLNCCMSWTRPFRWSSMKPWKSPRCIPPWIRANSLTGFWTKSNPAVPRRRPVADPGNQRELFPS